MRLMLLMCSVLTLSSISFSQNHTDGNWLMYHQVSKETNSGIGKIMTFCTFKSNQLYRKSIFENELVDTVNFKLNKDSLIIGKEAYLVTKYRDSILTCKFNTQEYTLRRLQKKTFNSSDFQTVVNFLTESKTEFTGFDKIHHGIKESPFTMEFLADSKKVTQLKVINQPCVSERAKYIPQSNEFWSLELYNQSLLFHFFTVNGGGLVFIDEITDVLITGKVVDYKTGELKTIVIRKL
jgi:hypothetical protein